MDVTLWSNMRIKTQPASKVDKKNPANFKMKSRILLRISLTSSHRIWEKNKASPLPFYHPVVDDLHHHYFPDRDCLPKLEMCDYAKVPKPNIWTLQHVQVHKYHCAAIHPNDTSPCPHVWFYVIENLRFRPSTCKHENGVFEILGCRKRRLRVDATPRRRKKLPFLKISGYVWTESDIKITQS